MISLFLWCYFNLLFVVTVELVSSLLTEVNCFLHYAQSLMLVQGFPNPVGSKQPVHSRNDVAKSLASDKQNSLQPIHFLCPCHSPSSPILMSYFNYSTPFPLLAITPALALVAVMLAAIVVNPVAAIVIGVAIVREEEELFG